MHELRFCTREKKTHEKKLKNSITNKKEKKSYWPRVRVRGNIDSKNKNKKITNKNFNKKPKLI